MLRNGTSPILFDPGCDPIVLEAYRSLRTSIKCAKEAKPLKTLLITSSIPGEGKSTVTVNLGFSLAHDGARVLLVDADLRSPDLHKIFRIGNTSGLTNAVTESYNTEVTSGILGRQGMGDLLQAIKFQEKTGWLKIQGYGQTYCLWFERGKITDATWENRFLEKRLGSVLVKEGKITERQLTEALQEQERNSHALGQILTRLGYIKWQDAEPILKTHLTESVHKVFELEEASYTFYKSESSRPKRDRLNNLENKTFLSKEVEDLINLDQPFIEEKIHSFIRETKIKNLMLMTSGSPTSIPSELLSSEKMKSLTRVLSNKFDFVIFDSPPVGFSADASILGSFSDGVILVVQAGRLGIQVVQQTKEKLAKVQANIIGVVFNQFDIKKEGYYYNYYYGMYGKKE